MIFKNLLYLFSFLYLAIALHAFNLIKIPNEATFLGNTHQSQELHAPDENLQSHTPV